MEIKELLGSLFKDGMTDAEIVEALKSMDAPKKDSADNDTIKHYKELISKANGEASKYKKQLQAKMTDDEKAEAQRKAEFEQMQTELNDLKTEKKISEQKAELVGIGYDSEHADAMAKAMVEGDLKAVIEGQKAFLEGYKKQVLADGLKGTPKPKSKKDSSHVPDKKFSEMSYGEMVRLYQEDPEEYERLKNERK